MIDLRLEVDALEPVNAHARADCVLAHGGDEPVGAITPEFLTRRVDAIGHPFADVIATQEIHTVDVVAGVVGTPLDELTLYQQLAVVVGRPETVEAIVAA